VPASVDIHIDIGAAALPTARPLFTRSRRLSASVTLTLCGASSLTVASTRSGILTLSATLCALCAAGSLLFALLLHFLHERLEAGGRARKDCRCLLRTYAKGQHRRGGAQHQQITHVNHP
jgi:hypothetical protein